MQARRGSSRWTSARRRLRFIEGMRLLGMPLPQQLPQFFQPIAQNHEPHQEEEIQLNDIPQDHALLANDENNEELHEVDAPPSPEFIPPHGNHTPSDSGTWEQDNSDTGTDVMGEDSSAAEDPNVFESDDEGGTSSMSLSSLESETEIRTDSSSEDADSLVEEEDRESAPLYSLNNASLSQLMSYTSVATLREALAMSRTKAIRYHWSHEALIADLTSVNVLQRNPLMPSYKCRLWQLLDHDETAYTCHVYCKSCRVHMGTIADQVEVYSCPVCHQEIRKGRASYFITLNLRRQFERFLGERHMSELLSYRETRGRGRPGGMGDILDGACYRQMQQPGNVLAGRFNYSYTFNTDGYRIANTSRLSTWCIYLMINELPPKLRRKHMILAAIWVDRMEPDTNLFMKPFVHEANLLMRQGVRWKPDGVREVISKIYPTVLTVDIPARYAIMNMNSFSSEYGCTFCLANGIGYDVNGVYLGSMKYPVEPHPLPRRTHDEIIAAMRASMHEDGTVLGVQRPAAIMKLDNWDAEEGVVVDPFHNLMLGLINQHMRWLTKAEFQNERYYIGRPNTIRAIDLRMKEIKKPSIIGRAVRPFSMRHLWTGAEWRSFLLYYLIPALHGILPDEYLHHLSMLSHAVFLLCTKEILQPDIDVADRLLREYRRKCQQYFGLRFMTYNLHLLTHTIEDVLNWGPLWAHSTCDYETLNGDMKKFITGPTDVAQQLLTRYLMSRFVREFVERPDISVYTRKWIKDQLGESEVTATVAIGSAHFKGWGVVRPPAAEEGAVLMRRGWNITTLHVYNGAVLNGMKYLKRAHGAAEHVDDSLLYCADDEICLLKNAAWFSLPDGNRVAGLFVRKCEQLRHVGAAKHVVQSLLTNDVIFVTAEEVQSPAVWCRINGMIYSSPISNLEEMH